jgi:hypothetical protein
MNAAENAVTVNGINDAQLEGQLAAHDPVMIDLEQQLAQAVAAGKSQRPILAKIERHRRETQRAALGRLAQVFDAFEFRDGVLSSAAMRSRPKELGACLKDREWATLQELDLASADHADLKGKAGEFFNSLPLLHTVLNLNPRLMPEVPCPRITRASMPQVDVGKLAQLFPGLRHLGFTFLTDPLPFWSHPFIEALESVTIRELTWSKGTLSTRSSFMHDAFVEWVEFGPPLQRLELPEEELMSHGELYGLQELFAAARRKGAEIIVTGSTSTEEHRGRRGSRLTRLGWSERTEPIGW